MRQTSAPSATPAPPRPPERATRRRSLAAPWIAVLALLAAALVGSLLARLAAPTLHNKMLPWILGRGLGLASLLSLCALTALGLWLHHPWRVAMGRIRPVSLLRAHSALAAATVMLVVGHLTALALDRYAGVGWVGALVPWQASYRPSPVALGTVALWMLVIVGASAGLAGVIGGRWLAIHRLAWLSFAVAWLHGVTAGSDTQGLRLVYLVTGAFVGLVALTRKLARPRLDPERQP